MENSNEDELIKRLNNLIEQRKEKDYRDYVIPFLLGCEFMVLVLIFLVVWV